METKAQAWERIKNLDIREEDEQDPELAVYVKKALDRKKRELEKDIKLSESGCLPYAKHRVVRYGGSE